MSKIKIIYKDLEYLGFRLDVFENVYDIREDSLLLAKSLLEEKCRKALVLCCGAGLEVLVLAKKGIEVTATDISPLAVENTKHNLKKNNLKAKVFQSNLFEKIKEKFDLIACNPPYVPSEKIKYLDLDGGKNGKEIIDKILKEYKNFLKPKGKLLILVSSLNKINDGEIRAKQKFAFEELQIREFSNE